MYSNSSAASRSLSLRPIILPLIALCALTSCGKASGRQVTRVTVSNPAMAYFVSRLAPADVEVNVMIPQGADHDTYTPRPSQMAALSSSEAYIAYGPLEFELTWKDRIISNAPGIKWIEVSDGVALLQGGHEGESADPHFWLSPRQAAVMSRNVAAALKSVIPSSAASVDSALTALLSDVAAADSALAEVAHERVGETFVVYHPALAYVARDYGLRQLCLGSESAAPSPRQLADLADSARRSAARVFFFQPGVTPDRLENLAHEMNTTLVPLQPEDADWPATMRTITSALR